MLRKEMETKVRLLILLIAGSKGSYHSCSLNRIRTKWIITSWDICDDFPYLHVTTVQVCWRTNNLKMVGMQGWNSEVWTVNTVNWGHILWWDTLKNVELQLEMRSLNCASSFRPLGQGEWDYWEGWNSCGFGWVQVPPLWKDIPEEGHCDESRWDAPLSRQLPMQLLPTILHFQKQPKCAHQQKTQIHMKCFLQYCRSFFESWIHSIDRKVACATKLNSILSPCLILS